MQVSALDFDSAPSIYIPLGLFLVASFIGFTACISVFNILTLPQIQSTINTGLTHLFTIGFFMMVMLGALFQVLPIVLGGNIRLQGLTSAALMLGIPFGLLFFVFALLYQISYLPLALTLIGLTLALFFINATKAVFQVKKLSNSRLAIALAFISLLITLALGIMMGTAFFVPQLHEFQIKQLHIIWAFCGWISLLIMGVSYQVIPMFHVTPPFRKELSYGLPATQFLSLLFITLLHAEVGFALLSVTSIIYATYSLKILSRRKRKVYDPTVRFWQLGLTCLILASISFWTEYATEHNGTQHLAGFLFLFGFAGSVIIGMLHKICPFLVFMHLQRISFKPPFPIIDIPTMHSVLPKSYGRFQFYIHLMSLTGLCFNAINEFGYLSLILMGALNFGFLSFCIIRSLYVYRKAIPAKTKP